MQLRLLFILPEIPAKGFEVLLELRADVMFERLPRPKLQVLSSFGELHFIVPPSGSPLSFPAAFFYRRSFFTGSCRGQCLDEYLWW